MRIILDYRQRIKNCDTDKAFAFRYSNYGRMVFLSKKHTTITEDFNITDTEVKYRRYIVEFPDWLFNMMQWDSKQSIELIQKENKQNGII